MATPPFFITSISLIIRLYVRKKFFHFCILKISTNYLLLLTTLYPISLYSYRATRL